MIKVVFIIFSILAIFLPNKVVFATNDPQQVFQHIILGDKPTRYTINEKNNKSNTIYEITAIGDASASVLYTENPRDLIIDYPYFEWSWRVDEIHKNADIGIKDKEDFPASIQFSFGKPNIFSRPKILAYAWVSDEKEIGTIIPSPRIPNNFKTIVIDNNQSALGVFKNYKRNIIEDYKKAYGHYPEKELSAFGFFTDNDQTQNPVKALYHIKLKNRPQRFNAK